MDPTENDSGFDPREASNAELATMLENFGDGDLDLIGRILRAAAERLRGVPPLAAAPTDEVSWRVTIAQTRTITVPVRAATEDAAAELAAMVADFDDTSDIQEDEHIVAVEQVEAS
jgi:hypothetical protein